VEAAEDREGGGGRLQMFSATEDCSRVGYQVELI